MRMVFSPLLAVTKIELSDAQSASLIYMPSARVVLKHQELTSLRSLNRIMANITLILPEYSIKINQFIY
jgi:hypothetical protein